jgi:hypothetical protein
MLKIAVLGIGNAGGQVANVACTRGFATFCINSSEKDLDIINEEIPVFLLGNSEGAGKDRRVAKDFVKQYYKSLLTDTFDEFMNKGDIIFIVSSTGGGTGSGMSIMLADILSRVYKNKVFINIGILPTLTDSIGAQRNTLEYMKEVNRLGKGYLLYDNNKYKHLTPSTYMNNINREIVDGLCYLRGDYSFKTKYGMIDDADMFKLLTVPGMINVSYYENFMEKDMEDHVMLDTYIIKVMKNNGTCQLDKDRIIKRMGVIVNLSEDLSRYYSPAMEDFKANVGEPLEVFEHYYLKDDDAEPNRLGVILSGLSIPDDRIQIIIQRIKEVEDMLNKKKDSSLLDSIDDMESLHVNALGIDRARSFEKADVNDIDFNFDEY